MTDCSKCKHAIWDYEDYYPGGWQWFIAGCKLGEDEESCESFEEEEGE